jgi:predicted SnoaL-like aldol condensation-catalyzing enzyme
MSTVAIKQWVKDYYTKLYSPHGDQAIDETLAPDYIEHQYTTGFTRDGLRNYVKSRLKENPGHRIIVHHMIAENDFVFLMAEEKLNNGVDVARGELFRLANGRIAEHWGSHVIDEKNRKNPNGTFDGAQVNPALDYGRRFVKQFEEMDRRGFDGQEIELFYVSRTPEYKQHSPKGGDGVEGLVAVLRNLKDRGMKMTMSPKRVIVEGDFIVCHRLYDSFPKHPLVNRINTLDMFRFNAEGKAVEHWDVMEDVPSEEMLAKMF